VNSVNNLKKYQTITPTRSFGKGLKK